MIVFITGGGGFIGSHLVESQLALGHQVRTIDLHLRRLAHIQDHPNLRAVICDITDTALVAQQLEGVEVIYHLASAHLDVSLSVDHYREVNVAATQRLLEAAQAAGVQRVVHCSSNGVLGELNTIPADETSPCQPTNIYEQTKLAGEQLALEFGQKTGLPIVVVRPAWVYGPRCPRTAKLIRSIRKGQFVMVGSGQTLRHPIYISDIIQGLELAAQADQAIGQIYFMAGEKPITIAELVQTIATICEVKGPVVYLPVWLGKLAGYSLQWLFAIFGRQPPFSRRSVDFFIKQNAYTITKAKNSLGFQPQVDLRTGIRQTIHWLDTPQ